MNEQIRPSKNLESKISDLSSRLLLHSSKLAEALSSLKKGQTEQKEIEQAARQAARLGEVIADQAWVLALRKVGMTSKTISEVWDAKDEEARKARIDSDIS